MSRQAVSDALQSILSRSFEEQATGIVQRGGLGSFYPVDASADPAPLDDLAARDALDDGSAIAVPNAGAGSYREFFARMGFVEIKVIDYTSSAGDWCFGVRRRDEPWILAFQSNRYPRHGFNYNVQSQLMAESFEDLCDLSAG